MIEPSSRAWRLVVLALALLCTTARAEAPPGGGGEEDGFDGATASLLSPAASSLQALAGKPIRGISVEVMGQRFKESPPVVKSAKLGAPLDGALVRKAIAELYDSGRYAQAFADARAYQDGVILRIRVVPRRIVADVEVSGGPFDRARVLRAAGIAKDGEITEATFASVAARLRVAYGRVGYDRAKIALSALQTDDPMRVLFRIAVEPGPRRTVSRRVFVIEPKLDKLVGRLKHDYAVDPGDAVDEDALLDADHEMAEALRKAGFLSAGVKHRVLRRGPSSFLYIYLETGPKHVFVFNGNARLGDSELDDALELKEGADPDPSALAARVREHYRARGYLDVRVTTTAEDELEGAQRRLVFDIHEGRPVEVVRRLFPCLPAQAPAGLGAADLGAEIDAVLAEVLPSMPALGAVDDAVLDQVFGGAGQSRAKTHRLAPAATYTAEAYAKALDHLRELLHSKGYLNARVGPVSVRRAECDPTARAGACDALDLPRLPAPKCAVGALDLPLEEPPLGAAHTCVPDPTRSITCAPQLTLVIPVQLGPRTTLYDIVFEGNKTIPSSTLMAVSELELGSPLSILELDAARLRVQNAYRDEGYAYASVRSGIDYSPDKTRARARFSITEHKPVIITEYIVHGLTRTDRALVIGRLALCREPGKCKQEDKYFKRKLVRQSEEQIATLGVFSSVSISLDDPDIPEEHKRVVITVVEQRSQYIEPRAGFSTGEGARFAFEYGHRNVGGKAIALTVRLELGFLPDFLILDDDVRAAYSRFVNEVSERLERRNSASVRFPEVGLGPRVDVVVDGIDVRDNQRDFGLTRQALIPTLSYRPIKNVTLQGSLSAEVNDVTLFEEGGVAGAIKRNPALANLLRVPEGRTIALAQRLQTTWDRRDNALSATRGTFLTAGVEHVSAFPLDQQTTIQSEFLRFTWRGAGYLRLSDKGMALALSVGGGYNLQLASDSQTYPDRLFYLGGVNSLRGFQLDAMVPEDIAAQVLDGKLDIDDVAVRGGNLFVNPRAELRIPITEVLSTGLFLDTGNVWASEHSIDTFTDLFFLRYTAGAGIRANTPIGPIALDGGIKLVRREWEDLGAVHFSIGLF